MRALARLAGPRFNSFAEAADLALGVLADALPPGRAVIAQIDREDGLYRVIDSRGEGIRGLEPQSTLRLTGAPAEGASSANGTFDPAFLSALSVQSYLSAPLAVGGDRVGILCAMSPATDVYTQAHADLLTVCSRLLAYEWESVRTRAELRRLSEAVRDGERSDPDTGLPNRAVFLASLQREWSLAQRGTLESHLIVFDLDGLPAIALKLGGPLATLLLKDAAEILTVTLRQTDCAGRVGDSQLAAVLVGCKGEEGVEAFASRFRFALEGLWGARPARPELSRGSCPLDEASSPEAALQLAGERARAPHAEKAT
jgi:diguanylate cyclase (GGDEF)-like protein